MESSFGYSKSYHPPAPVVSLTVRAVKNHSHIIPGIHAVGMEFADEVIIGRDVLNHLIVTLDGIGSIAEIH